MDDNNNALKSIVLIIVIGVLVWFVISNREKLFGINKNDSGVNDTGLSEYRNFDSDRIVDIFVCGENPDVSVGMFGAQCHNITDKKIMDELLLELDEMEYVRDISESDIFSMVATVNVNYDDESYAKIIIYNNGILYVNFDSTTSNWSEYKINNLDYYDYFNDKYVIE